MNQSNLLIFSDPVRHSPDNAKRRQDWYFRVNAMVYLVANAGRKRGRSQRLAFQVCGDLSAV